MVSDQVSPEDVILATGGYDHTIRFWTPHNGICQRIVQHPDSQVNCLEVTPDKHLLAAAGFQHIRMYEVGSNNPNPVVNYEGVSKNVTSVGFHEDGRWMFSGGEDGQVRVWDLRQRSLQCQKCLTVGHPVNTVALHPNQAELFIGDQNGTITVWDLHNDRQDQVLIDSDVVIQSLDIDADGTNLAAVDNKGHCYTLAVHRGNDKLKKRLKMNAHKRYALRCRYSPDSTQLVTTSADQTAKIWRCADLISSFVEGDSSDDKSTGSGSVTSSLTSNAWVRVDSIRPVVELKEHGQRWVWAVAWSADSQFVITASSDNNARLWSAATGDVKREYSGHQKAITAMAFSDSRI